MSLVAVVMAAGKGTRMRSERAKVLHELLDVPMLHYTFEALRGAGVRHVVAVVGHQREAVEAAIQPCRGWFETLTTVVQEPQNGTGHAVMVTADLVQRFQRTLVLNGDMPCLTAAALKRFFVAHDDAGARLSAVTMLLDDPTGFGRVVRGPDGAFVEIVEHKDARERPDVLALREVNAGVYLAETRHLFNLLDGLSNDNAQGEYYLPDVLATSREWGEAPHLYVEADATLMLGINTRRDLFQAERVLQARQIERALAAGVTVRSPDVRIAPDAVLGDDVCLHAGVELRHGCVLGRGVVVETGSVLTNVRLDDGAAVKPYCVLEGAVVGAGAAVGPFARLRPGAVLEAEAHVGNFVELKNTRLGQGSKANHLSYLGDADIGRRVNVGAGTITCNYDGYAKYRTILDDDVLIGSDTQLVAPVKVGARAVVGAGTTVTADVPPGALALTRPEKVHVGGYRDRLEARYVKKDDRSKG